ncbi:MAG: PilW family protein [Thermoanaerobaculia bacterium]
MRKQTNSLDVGCRPESGFTLIEMVISLAATTILLLGVLAVFDSNAKLAKVQTEVTDAQQALRAAQDNIVRMARMAGRGGLITGNLPLGIALAVRNNVDDEAHISPLDDNTPAVLDGTDVLTIRGVFTTPIYQLRYNQTPVTVNGPLNAPTGGTITVVNSVAVDGVDASNLSAPQNLQPLIQAVTAQRPEALILYSSSGDRYAVVELDPSNSVVNNPAQITIGFKVTGGTHTTAYQTLDSTGVFPSDFFTQNPSSEAAYLGILEEYRFYVRELRVNANLMPILARAQVYPGTESPYAEQTGNWDVEIAENVFDLQVALGIDRDRNGTIVDGAEAASSLKLDEVLFNHFQDNANDTTWDTGRFGYLRLTTLTRTDRPDPQYQAPQLLLIEDHDYAGSEINSEEGRMYRRRVVTTNVDLRNIG